VTSTGLRLAVLHNLQDNAPPLPAGAPADALYELDSPKNVRAYTAALAGAGHQIIALEGDLALPERLAAFRPDLCFNTCEGYRGDSREAQIPALLEMLGLRYTGSKVLALALTLDKAMTKRVLGYHDLPTPAFQVFYAPDDPLDPALRYPLFAKPVAEGTGIGIGGDSILASEAALRERVSFLLAAYRQPVLVEEYIEGPDLTVGLIGNVPAAKSGLPRRRLGEGDNGAFAAALRAAAPDLHVLPMTQMLYDQYPPGTEPVYSSRLKVDLADDFRGLCPAPLPEALTAELAALAAATFWACGCLDVARIDFRLDARAGLRPMILEINALPGLTPISDLTIMAEAQGWSHAELIVAVANAALRRYGLPVDEARDPLRRVVRAG
jgi:D-alanine-D-alanine ligase